MYRATKRSLDIAMGIAVAVASLPFLIFGLVGSAMVHRTNSLFVQERTGLNGKPFSIYKIKSMRCEIAGADNSDEARLTGFGRFIRKTSIDELPQIINIIRGDMSFVGPRPQKHIYYKLMNENERRRYSVPPGLSGWSQVQGRNGVTWRERFKQDLWYVDNASFGLDLWILWRTVIVVLTGHNVTNGTSATMHSLDEELREESKAVAVSGMPPILASYVENNLNAVVSFSLYDPNEMHPATENPRDLFAFYNIGGNKQYHKVYFSIWRRPKDSSYAFPAGIVGPFDVDIRHDDTVIQQTSETCVYNAFHEKPKLRSMK